MMKEVNKLEITCGIDIIEIDRIKKCIEPLDDKFRERVYTEKEIRYCESKNKQKYQHYAARFAGKEAVVKAISSTLKNKYEISWKEIEILNDETGKPYVKLPEENTKEIEDIDISISHCKQYAVANVVILYK